MATGAQRGQLPRHTRVHRVTQLAAPRSTPPAGRALCSGPPAGPEETHSEVSDGILVGRGFTVLSCGMGRAGEHTPTPGTATGPSADGRFGVPQRRGQRARAGPDPSRLLPRWVRPSAQSGAQVLGAGQAPPLCFLDSAPGSPLPAEAPLRARTAHTADTPWGFVLLVCFSLGCGIDGVASVNELTEVSGVQFRDTPCICCAVHSPPPKFTESSWSENEGGRAGGHWPEPQPWELGPPL